MWNDLSMRQKSDLISLGVKNGITDLTTIKDIYNKYAEGGPKKSYSNWKTELSDYWNENIDNHDYDYEKYYNDDPERAYNQLDNILSGNHAHFPDSGKSGIYKKLSHPTYPDLGEKSWSNNDTVFHISDRQLKDTDRILNYLGEDLNYNSGSTKVMYKDSYILPSVTVTPNNSYSNLVPNKLHTGWVYEDNPMRAAKYSEGDHLDLDLKQFQKDILLKYMTILNGMRNIKKM